MAVFVAYFDASGHRQDKNCRAMTVAGFISTESKWARFEKAWKGVLDAEGVSMLHMKEFARSAGEFARWKGDEPRRVAFLQSLVRVIKRHTHRGFSATLLLADYESVNADLLLEEHVGTPYTVACEFVMALVRLWMVKRQPSADGVLLVFEQGDADQADLRRFLTRHPAPGGEPPIFLPKKPGVTAPLEAADFLAYENGKAFNDMLRTGKRQARKSGAPFMPRQNDIGFRFLDRVSLRLLSEDLKVPPRAKGSGALQPNG